MPVGIDSDSGFSDAINGCKIICQPLFCAGTPFYRCQPLRLVWEKSRECCNDFDPSGSDWWLPDVNGFQINAATIFLSPFDLRFWVWNYFKHSSTPFLRMYRWIRVEHNDKHKNRLIFSTVYRFSLVQRQVAVNFCETVLRVYRFKTSTILSQAMPNYRAKK